MEPVSQQGPRHSLLKVLHEAPTVLELLTPEALKNLSVTCRSLRTSFCAQVTNIRLSDPHDMLNLCCKAWPKLLMVVCKTSPWLRIDLNLKRKLTDQWEFMVEMETALETALLIRSRQQLQSQNSDLPSQHCAALSRFADKVRYSAMCISLRGPLVRSWIVQSLVREPWPNLGWISIAHSCPDVFVLLTMGQACPLLISMSLCNNQLDNSTISAMTPFTSSHLAELYLNYNMLGVAGICYLVSCSLPSLEKLGLEHAGIDGPASQCLSQGKWPALQKLFVVRNNIDTCAASYLIQGNGPCLTT